ncbi:MAG: hypothetical protein ABIR18_07675, partial [Chitinophagaceae bacterium]
MIKNETMTRDIQEEKKSNKTLTITAIERKRPTEAVNHDDEIKIEMISNHFQQIMEILGLD